MPAIRFAAAQSTLFDSPAAVEEVCLEIQAGLTGAPHVVFAFYSPHHNPYADRIASELRARLGAPWVIGASFESVIGPRDELEATPAIAVLSGRLPGADLLPFEIAPGEWESLLNEPDALGDRLQIGPTTRAIILMGDPFSTPAEELLQALGVAAPGVPLIGGMASAGQRPGHNTLLGPSGAMASGLVGLVVSGAIRVDAVVSQGCTPVGERMLVTRAENEWVTHLMGRPALEVAEETLRTLPDAQRDMLSNGLFVGVAMTEYRTEFGRGDFLVRNMMGVDRKHGSLAVGAHIRAGQTVQFHVRDAATADEDLRSLLGAHSTEAAAPAAALVFSCNGRGSRLFSEPSHDLNALLAEFPGLPAAGCFAAGEIGPVGQKSYLHGHTASIALFSEAD